MKWLFKKEKEYIQLLQQTERPLTIDERKLVLREIEKASRLDLKVIINLFRNLPNISDAKVKTDKIKLLEEILLKRPVKGLSEDLIDILKSTVDSVTKTFILKILVLLANEDEIDSYIELLRSGDIETRRVAINILKELKHVVVSKKLVEELKKGEWRHKGEALNLLYEISRIDCISICRDLMRVGTESDKRQSIQVLRKMASDEAISVLNEGLNDPNPRIRLMIANSLKEIASPAAAYGLSKLLGDKKIDIVLIALDGLAKIGSRKPIGDIIKLLELKNIEYKIQLKAIEVLGILGNENEAPVLIELLKDPDLQIRQTATDAIFRISQKPQTNISKLLLGLMSDHNVNVRRCVAEILNQIKDETIFSEMFKFLKDEDWWVREAIVETLSEIKDPRVVPAAIELLEHEDERMRRYGIEILVGIKEPQAVNHIIKLLNDPDWWVRERAVEALGYLGDKRVVPLLIQLLQVEELTYTVATALGRLGDKRAIEPLQKMLDKVHKDTKIKILESLAQLDAKSAIESIKKLLISPDKDVRLKAKEVLRKLGFMLKDELSVADRWWEKQNLSMIDFLLLETKSMNGTDLFLISGMPPKIRIEGEIVDLEYRTLTEAEIMEQLSQILRYEDEIKFKEYMDLDFSYEIPQEARFRGNIFRHKDGVTVVFRFIPDEVPTLEGLGIPGIIREFAHLKQGLVLFSGPASCGKTSTMAALIEYINNIRFAHIITVEDPIEYIFENKNCVITQKEVGRHTKSFANSIRAALREDPDIIMIGELRDHETISLAITAAETGHLVLATIHSISAPKTIDRIIDVYPTEQQHQVRIMLSETLKGVVSQQLLYRKDGKGRVAAFEILIATNAVRNLIREQKVYQIPSIMTTSREIGMITMDQYLAELVKNGLVSAEEAYLKATDKETFEQFMELERSA